MQGAQRPRKVTNQLMKRASEMWQSLTPFERESWKEAYQQQMEIFKTYQKTEAKKQTKEAKKKKKEKLLAKELDKKLLKEEVAGDECWPMKWRKRRMKKSVTGYFLFCKAKRRVVQTNLKTNEFSYVAKKLSEQWKELSDAQRYFWCREAQRQAREQYIKSLKDESRKRRREHRRRQGAKRNKNL